MKVDAERTSESSQADSTKGGGRRNFREHMVEGGKKVEPVPSVKAARDTGKKSEVEPPPKFVLGGPELAAKQVATIALAGMCRAEGLNLVRRTHDVQSFQLVDVRHERVGEGREDEGKRVLEWVRGELEKDLEPPPPDNSLPPPVNDEPPPPSENEPQAFQVIETSKGAADHSGRDGTFNSEASRTAQVQAALELVQKIEVFMKSQRPALSVTVGGALAAQVQVEKTGPREVALNVRGLKGPPQAEDLSEIRAQIQAKGLKISSLTVA